MVTKTQMFMPQNMNSQMVNRNMFQGTPINMNSQMNQPSPLYDDEY